MSDLSAGADALDCLDDRVKRLNATLASLGWDVALRQLLSEIPDASERLRYVAQMTESAAMKVLNLVDHIQPACQQVARASGAQADRLEALLADPGLTLDAARQALADSASALRHNQGCAAEQAEALTSIMLAQDFQDLSGQVIKKVVGIIHHTEDQLRLLLADHPEQAPAAAPVALAGPQVPEKAVAQADVDDLLASLGF